jgi:hypothetical protein
MADIFARLAMPVLQKLSDGTWRNFCGHEGEYAPISFRDLLADGMGLGVAIARGWAERNEGTWARITPSGAAFLKTETDAARLWYIRKGGYFYRPHASGYTESAEEAGRYTYEEALARASSARGVTMHKITEWPPEGVTVSDPMPEAAQP